MKNKKVESKKKLDTRKVDTRKKVESAWWKKLNSDWSKCGIVVASTEFETPMEGYLKTLGYWHEFLRTEDYEEYWESWMLKRNPCLQYHFNHVGQLFERFVRNKRNLTGHRILWGRVFENKNVWRCCSKYFLIEGELE